MGFRYVVDKSGVSTTPVNIFLVLHELGIYTEFEILPLGSFFSLMIGFVYSLLALFDVFPAVTQNLVVQLLNQVLTFLGLIGVIVDPTTAGLGDSERAMGYEVPFQDDAE